MFTVIKAHYAGNEKSYIEATCKSADPKQTDGVANGSICLEMDTSKFYAFDESATAWLELE